MTALIWLLKALVTALPAGTIFGWVARRVWLPDIRLTGRRHGSQYRFILDYGEDETLRADIDVAIAVKNGDGGFIEGPVLFCGPRNIQTNEDRSDRRVYRVAAKEMSPFARWIIDCTTNGLENNLSFTVKIQQQKKSYEFETLATEPSPSGRARTGKYLWAALGAAVAAFLWPFVLQSVTGWDTKMPGATESATLRAFESNVDFWVIGGMAIVMGVIYLLLVRFWRIGEGKRVWRATPVRGRGR